MISNKLEQWVNDFSDELYRWAFFKTSKKEIAEDLVQDTFLAASKGLDNFKGKSNPKTWLFSILNNKIADYHKNVFREKKAGFVNGSTDFFDDKGRWIEKEKPDKWEDSPHLLDDSEFLKILQKCMSALPELWFSAMTMKYLKEKKGPEICQELGVTDTNYWQILRRAKLQLRSCLDVNWFKGTDV